MNHDTRASAHDDHRDSTLPADGFETSAIADDLFLDAILSGRATDDDASIRARVRSACDALDAPLASIGSGASSRSQRWRPLVAAAVVVAAVGLLTMLVALPSPAYATAHGTVDASIERLESTDLTFRISVETEDTGGPGSRRPSGLQRRFDGATLHVSGPRIVLLSKGRDDEILARGHDGEQFWSNHLPEDVESAMSARGDRGIPFQRFLESIDGDLRGMLDGLRRGYELSHGEVEIDPEDGASLRRFSGIRRAASATPSAERSSDPPPAPHGRPMRGGHPRGRFGGHAERFDIWIDDDGNLRRLRLSGMPGRDGGTIGNLVLQLVDTAPLDDAVFDPATYPDIEHGPTRREGGPPRPPRPPHPPHPPHAPGHDESREHRIDHPIG